MQLKTLSLNKALFSNLSRSIIFLTIINLICTFILVPFSYVIAHLDTSAEPHDHSKYLIGEMMTMPIYFIGTMIYSLLCAAFLTYYFKSQAASDFIHSLPIKRERILTTAYAVFFSHLLVNLVVNGLITWVVGIKYASIDVEKIFIWIVVNLVVDFFIFTITMLFGLFINNMLNHLVSSIILIASPFILGTMVYTTHMFMFKGLESYPDDLMMKLTIPIQFINDIVVDKLDFKYLLMVFIASLVMFILLFVIYKRRKNERINEAYATNYAHFIVFFISMLIATLLGGIIFNSIFNEQKLITIFIYLVSFTLIYIFLEMIAQKSVRINFNRKLYLMTLGMIAISIVAIYISGYMREQYVPEADEVKSVIATIEANDYSLGESILNQIPVSDKGFIQDTIEGNKGLIKEKKATSESDNQYPVDITYKLNNGRKIERNYYVNKKAYMRYMNIVGTKENVQKKIDDIKWNELVKKEVQIMHETEDESYAGQGLSNEQANQLIKLLPDKIKDTYLKVDKIPFSNSNYNITFSSMSEGEYGNENQIMISLYDDKIIQFLLDEKIIKRPSSIFPSGPIYDLGNKSNYEKFDEMKDIDAFDFAKKIKREDFAKLYNNQGADREGNHLYYFASTLQYVLMK